jgi:hypothetical protein
MTQHELFPNAGILQPDALSGTRKPASSLSAGIIQPDALSGTGKPAAKRFWAIDVGADGGKGAVAYDRATGEWHQFKSLQECIKGCPHKEIRLERSFANYDVATRPELLALAAERGIVVKTVPGRMTARYRRNVLKEEKTTDKRDSQIVSMLNEQWWHISRIAAPDHVRWVRDVNTELRNLRRTGVTHSLTDIMPGVFGRIEIATRFNLLCGANRLPYNMCAAVIIAALVTRSRHSFERLLGLHGNGHASQFRSEVYHHGWRPNKRRRESSTLSEYRRQLRALRRETIAHADEFLRAIPELAPLVKKYRTEPEHSPSLRYREPIV